MSTKAITRCDICDFQESWNVAGAAVSITRVAGADVCAMCRRNHPAVDRLISVIEEHEKSQIAKAEQAQAHLRLGIQNPGEVRAEKVGAGLRRSNLCMCNCDPCVCNGRIG